jgi:hypothetical protein
VVFGRGALITNIVWFTKLRMKKLRSQLVRIITVNEALSNVPIAFFLPLLKAIALNILPEVLLLDQVPLDNFLLFPVHDINF